MEDPYGYDDDYRYQPYSDDQFQESTAGAHSYILGVISIFFGLVFIAAAYFLFIYDDNLPANATTSTDSIEAAKNDSEPISPTNPYPEDTNAGLLELSENDKARAQIFFLPGLRLTTARISQNLDGLPKNAAEAAYINSPAVYDDDKLWKDPATGKPYKIVDGLPGKGEIQYITGYVCTENFRNKTPEREGFHGTNWVLMMRLDDNSFICKSGLYLPPL